MQPYNEQFYQNIKERSRRSAKEVIPLVLELIQPRSVVDVGCGAGTWLSVFKEFGIDDFLGVDGDWVDKKMLEIPEERFLAFDLTTPLRIDKQFDLVVSLEVAEHLPSECAEMLVESLTRLGPVILFSAAIPFQGGTHHVNEQWPEYWVKFFRERRYFVIDCIRKKIWQNDNVEWFYAQNILMFVRWDYLENHPLLKKEFENTSTCQLSIVHPKKYLEVHRLLLTMQDITALIPPGDTFILVDHEVFRAEVAPGRNVIPFLERDGQYWGLPPDDATAIHELERLCRTGARFIVFAWPAFWWFDYYAEFYRYLLSNFSCVLQNERIVVFDLHS
jgi:SAM-dependent methyltransferase